MLKLLKQNKMFRVLVLYQFFTSLGAAMFSMFILLSVHLIYQNPIYTGIAGFLIAAPRVLSIAAGPIVDRRNKVTIIRITTLFEFIVLSLLAFTPLQEQLGVLFTFAVIFAYSVLFLFEEPAGTALLPQIVHEEEIMKANSLMSIVIMVGGLGIGIVLLLSLGTDVNFRFLYGFSAVFVVFAFIVSLFLKSGAAKETAKKSSSGYLADIKEGVKFIRGSILLYLILAAVTMNFVREIAYINRPMFLEYYVGAQGYILFSLVGLIGGVFASVFVGTLGNNYKVGRLLFALIVPAGIVRIIFALVVPVQLIAGLIAVAVFSALIYAVGIIFSSLNQKVPNNDMVGRVNTMSATFSSIAVALGALVGGFLGSIVPDAGHIFIYEGISYGVIGLLIILVPSIRKLPKMNEINKSGE